MSTDFVLYIDTDSLFINLYKFIEEQGLKEVFDSLNDEDKVMYIGKIASAIQDYVNEQSFEVTQKIHYNSPVDDFKLSFKSEKICSSGLFVKKKKYSLWTVLEEGYKPKNNLQVTGLDIIKSSTPIAVKEKIKDALVQIMNSKSPEDLSDIISRHKKELLEASPEEIAENMTCRNLHVYIDKNLDCKLGTPRHTKGVASYKKIVKQFKLETSAENIESDDKVKVVYLLKNPLRLQSISFIRWLKEFNDIGLEIDYDKMIENTYTSKVIQLLEAANIEIQDNTNKDILSMWLGT